MGATSPAHAFVAVNVIGAHGVLLNSTTLSAADPWSGIALTGPATHESYRNAGTRDLWVQMLLTAGSSGPSSSMTCRTGTMAVCTYAVTNNTAGQSSCGFILPAGVVLECSATGGMSVTAASTRPFTDNVVPPATVSKIPLAAATCPPITGATKSTMCDCAYTNPHANQDMIIGMSATSADANFNSFHCYVYGVNVCAWGSNLNNQRDAGSCYFILPAGATYNCTME